MLLQECVVWLTVFARILYFVAAVCNLFGGLPPFQDSYGNAWGNRGYPSRNHRYYSSRETRVPRSPFKRIFGPLTDLMRLAWSLVQDLFAPVFTWLPNNTQAHIRYSFRSAGRWTRTKISAKASKAHALHIHLPRHLHRSKACDEKLAQMLLQTSSYNVLQLLAGKLHYVDLVSLSLVSKRMRATIFPSLLEGGTEDRQLRYYSCTGDAKAECWTCGIQVCEDCSKRRTSLDSLTSLHMMGCSARCASCFRTYLSRPRRERRPCYCYNYNTWSGWWDNRSIRYRSLKDRVVCRDCNRLSDDKLMAAREHKDKMVYRRLVIQSLACGECKVLLPKKGCKWWVHGECGRECRGSCHPRFVESVEV
jgi:hypothetical protein